jgi:hypothetical protein
MSKLGSNNFSVKIGNDVVTKIYIGSTLVYILSDTDFSYIFEKDKIYSWI